jgi:hypothetical protein
MRTRVAARGVLLLVVAAWAAGAWAAAGYTPPTPDAFLKSIRSYPFAAGAERREKIRLGVPRLARCMPSPEVRALIGDPDFGYATNKGGLGAMNWTYVLEKKALKEVEPSSRVVVWLDPEGRIQGVTVHGAPDIEATVSRRPGKCS